LESRSFKEVEPIVITKHMKEQKRKAGNWKSIYLTGETEKSEKAPQRRKKFP